MPMAEYSILEQGPSRCVSGGPAAPPRASVGPLGLHGLSQVPEKGACGGLSRLLVEPASQSVGQLTLCLTIGFII